MNRQWLLFSINFTITIVSLCHLIGKNCYVGDIPYEILIKAEDEAITSQTPVYE
jgi:hypothetical protein